MYVVNNYFYFILLRWQAALSESRLGFPQPSPPLLHRAEFWLDRWHPLKHLLAWGFLLSAASPRGLSVGFFQLSLSPCGSLVSRKWALMTSSRPSRRLFKLSSSGSFSHSLQVREKDGRDPLSRALSYGSMPESAHPLKEIPHRQVHRVVAQP